jgi:hypothetical protein
MQREDNSNLEQNLDSCHASPHCVAWQFEVNFKMRQVLVDWLVDVHLNFKLLPETLFITINLMDRYI